jgi:hypothetical protein
MNAVTVESGRSVSFIPEFRLWCDGVAAIPARDK